MQKYVLEDGFAQECGRGDGMALAQGRGTERYIGAWWLEGLKLYLLGLAASKSKALRRCVSHIVHISQEENCIVGGERVVYWRVLGCQTTPYLDKS